MFENLSSKQLIRAAQIKEQIERLENELDQLMGGSTSSSPSKSGSAVSSGKASGSGKGPISAAGLARIKAAQKARWAKFRKEKGSNGSVNGTSSSSSTVKARRTMSPAAKAKIRAAAKARWAKAKAAGKTSL